MTQIVGKYSDANIEIHTFNQVSADVRMCLFVFGTLLSPLLKIKRSVPQSQYPRLVVEDFSPLPSKGIPGKDGWSVDFDLGF